MPAIEENKSLKEFNTFGIECRSRYFVRIKSETDLIEVFKNEKFKNIEKMIIGGGSNILFTKDYTGLVIKNEIPGIKILSEDDENVLIESGAGVVWHDFVLFCIGKNFAGIENLSLIPGCVGAAPMQNIGAYGVEVKDVIEEVHALDLSELKKVVFSNKECGFGYRDSIFKNIARNKYCITKVVFRLNKNPEFKTSYGAITEELAKFPDEKMSIKKISDAVIRIRQSKLPDPAIIGNAGSFFKNPEVDKDFAIKLKNEFPEMVIYPVSENKTKIAAGWLIEKAGWKGFKQGDFGVHKNQALVLVNYGNAHGRQILDLSDKIISSVFEKYGISLEREVNIV